MAAIKDTGSQSTLFCATPRENKCTSTARVTAVTLNSVRTFHLLTVKEKGQWFDDWKSSLSRDTVRWLPTFPLLAQKRGKDLGWHCVFIIFLNGNKKNFGWVSKVELENKNLFKTGSKEALIVYNSTMWATQMLIQGKIAWFKFLIITQHLVRHTLTQRAVPPAVIFSIDNNDSDKYRWKTES